MISHRADTWGVLGAQGLLRPRSPPRLGPLDLVPAPCIPSTRRPRPDPRTGPPPNSPTPRAPGGRLRRLRAFVELHRPSTGTEQAAQQLAACARLWQQPGQGGNGRAWERRWRTFPTVLVVLTGTQAASVTTAVEDLLLAAEENPATTELLAARLEDLTQHGPAAPVWHPLSGEGGPQAGWTGL
ncbi:hypothetical protein [Kitasatospora sp. CMC57]